jgi:chromosome segregation ATPase
MRSDQNHKHPQPRPTETEQDWQARKKALFKKPFLRHKAKGADLDDFEGQREELAKEIESLEEENLFLVKEWKELESELKEKRSAARAIYEKSDETQRNLAGVTARERDLSNEIEFLKSERARVSEKYSYISEELESNISALDSTVRSISFIKGEMDALVEKMDSFEEEVPSKARDVDHLDKKLDGTTKAVRDLYDRMQRVERKVKVIYYK